MSCIGGCGFFGSPATGGFCSSCARKNGFSVVTAPPPASSRSASGYGKTSEVKLALTLPTGQTVEIRHGDLTKEEVDAIVNAANSQLRHASGVAGAIVKVGGQIIQDISDIYVAEHGDIPVGEVCTTAAGTLPCKFLIHAVGPTWFTGHQGEIPQLELCILNILRAGSRDGAKSISIPAISSGVFGFPKELCANIMLTAIVNYFQLPEGQTSCVTRVCLTNFDDETVGIFLKEAKDYVPGVPRTLPDPPPITDEMRRMMALEGRSFGGGITGGGVDAPRGGKSESRILRDGRVLECRCGFFGKTDFSTVVCSDQSKADLKEAGGEKTASEIVGMGSTYPAMINGGELIPKKLIFVADVRYTGTKEVDEENFIQAFNKAWSVLAMLGSSYTTVEVAPIGIGFDNRTHAILLVRGIMKAIAQFPAIHIRGIRITTKDSALSISIAQALVDCPDFTSAEISGGRPGESAEQRRRRERAEAEARFRAGN